MDFKRKRYQFGSLTIEKRKTGQAVWVYRWRENTPDGKRIKRKVVVGTKKEFPTKVSARKQVDAMELEINSTSPVRHCSMTISELIDHYRGIELSHNCGKTVRTIEVYEQHFKEYIIPKWGTLEIDQVKTVAVEKWLKPILRAPGTKTKIRNVLSCLFRHAMRHEFTATNPISLVRQSGARVKEPETLTAEEVSALLVELQEPFRTIVELAATTGMRRSELFGLKWEDVDFKRGLIRIKRSIVDQEVGRTKTPASNAPSPVHAELLNSLQTWRETTRYGKDWDWVFASPQALGELPYWPNAVLIRHVHPAAIRADIAMRIGWHTFRHTYATLLLSTNAPVKVTQELMRHSSPVMTLGTYAKAVTEDKRTAQAKVAALYRNPKEERAVA